MQPASQGFNERINEWLFSILARVQISRLGARGRFVFLLLFYDILLFLVHNNRRKKKKKSIKKTFGGKQHLHQNWSVTSLASADQFESS